MLKTTCSFSRRIISSIALTLLSIVLLGALFYAQTKSWLLAQQKERLVIAIRQINTLTENMERAARSASVLADQSCSPPVLHELRRILAQAPNVANIELSSRDVIYCSSLSGKEHQIMRDRHSLYLTNDIEELPGHPYLVLRLGKGDSAVFVSADGYYLRNILEAASMQLPVIFIASEGWMNQNGVIHNEQVPPSFAFHVPSTDLTYRLASRFDNAMILKIIINDSKLILIGILSISLFAGMGYYIWSGRPRPPIQELISAISNDKIVPYIQPIVRSSDFRPVGGEILARWMERGSAVPPAQFIALAELNDLIIPLTRSLIAQIADNLLSDFQPITPFFLSFNVSAPHFESSQLTADFSLLTEGNARNIQVLLEITEREALTYGKNVAANVARLKEMGVRLALDDFGTGYASLEYFQHIHIDSIKIDRMFVQRLGEDPLCSHIVANVADLANRLGLTTIAEGVETESQAEFLRDNGVDYLQGYLFSRPLPIAEFKTYISKYL